MQHCWFSLIGPNSLPILVIPRLFYKNAHVLLSYVQTAKFPVELPQTPPPNPLLQTAGISMKEGRIDEVGLCCAHNQLWK